jgi:serine/threonine-protein kinase
LDFGVSKWLGPAPDLTTPLSTAEGSFIGTPAYVSPEQLTQPDSVDQRADVWALGVVLYQCLSGRLPFQADSVPRLCAEILTAPPRPLDSGISLPSGFEMVILNCLRKELGERYPSILSLSQALTPFAPPTSLHLLDSIRALSQKIAADERPSAEPSEKPPAVEVPQTTLNFSHEADLAQKVYPSDTRARRRRTRWLALLAIAAAAALITRATWRTDTPASAPEDLTRAASVAPPSQPRRPEPTPNTSPSPPLTVAETAPPPPLRNAPAPSRSAANAGHARPSSSARLAAVAGASAETKAQPPSSASSAPAAPAQPARPVEQPSNPDAINPAELYRH